MRATLHHTHEAPATLTIDGSCDQKTHQAGAAAILKLPDGTRASTMEALTTNKSSEAEVHALKIGLELAAEHHITHLIVYGDNQSVTDAVNGHARFPHGTRNRMRELLKGFQEVHAVHLDRNDNNADLPARLARPDDYAGRSRRQGRNPTRRGRSYHRNKRKRRSDPDRRYA